MKMYLNLQSLTCRNPNSITGKRNSNCATIVPTINAHIFAKWFSSKISPHSLTTPVSRLIVVALIATMVACRSLMTSHFNVLISIYDLPPPFRSHSTLGVKRAICLPFFHVVSPGIIVLLGLFRHTVGLGHTIWISNLSPKKTVVRCLPACVHFYFVVFSGPMSVSILFMRILLLTICTRFGIATSFGNKPSVMNIQLCNGFKNGWMLPEIGLLKISKCQNRYSAPSLLRRY